MSLLSFLTEWMKVPQYYYGANGVFSHIPSVVKVLHDIECAV